MLPVEEPKSIYPCGIREHKWATVSSLSKLPISYRWKVLRGCACQTWMDRLSEPFKSSRNVSLNSGIQRHDINGIVPVDHDNFFPTSFCEFFSVCPKNIIISCLSLNQPFGLYHAFVCVGPGGIITNEQSPTHRVIKPSMRKRYLHPALPPTPRSRKIPVARKALTISDV